MEGRKIRIDKSELYKYTDFEASSNPSNYAGGHSARQRLCTYVLLVFGFIAVIMVYLGLKRSNNAHDQFGASHGSTNALHDFPFAISRNGYSPLDMTTYGLMSKYNFIVEPNAIMIANSESDDEVSSLSICVNEMSCNLWDNIATFTVHCEPQDTLSITAMTTSGFSYTGVGICLYVRREIRDLTQHDLESTLTAMSAIWKYSESNGQLLFGNSFHNINYFSELYFLNNGMDNSDHISEGVGFLLQHAKLTRIFESAMQAVDNNTCLTYWDFTIDSNNGSTAIYESFVMTADIFGTPVIPSDALSSRYAGWDSTEHSINSGQIVDGLWSQTEISNNIQFSSMNYSYGYLRMPWNLNPSPYLSRFMVTKPTDRLPSCKDHYDMLGYDNLMNFLGDMESQPISSVFYMLGGVYGCDHFTELMEQGYIDSIDGLKSLCQGWPGLLKDLYRSHIITAPAREECATSNDDDYTPSQTNCRMVCVASYDTVVSTMKKRINNVPDDMSEQGWEAWADFLCTGAGGFGVYAGDGWLQSAAGDPVFWVTLPTVERLLHAKLSTAAGFTGEGGDSWNTQAVDEYVCEHAKCYESVLDEGGQTKGVRDTYSDCCYGHYQQDQLYDYVSASNEKSYIGLSNENLYDQLNTGSADNYNMPYMYQHFKWAHCSLNFQKILSQ